MSMHAGRQEWIVHNQMSLEYVQGEVRLLTDAMGWSAASGHVVGRIVAVLAEHVIRHAAHGRLEISRIEGRLELRSIDRGRSFLRIYSAVRETGLTPPNRAGIYEVETPVHGSLAMLRTLADELQVRCDPGRGTEVFVVLRSEPTQIPHAPCPCLIADGPPAARRPD